MRVIAGKFRSRPLHSLRGMDLRPTADRLRETLFNVLAAGNAAAFEGKVWFDLFAGTGAVGIEALSRGAAKLYFVESSPSAATLIRRESRRAQNRVGLRGVEAGRRPSAAPAGSEERRGRLHLSRSSLPPGEGLCPGSGPALAVPPAGAACGCRRRAHLEVRSRRRVCASAPLPQAGAGRRGVEFLPPEVV